jgi:hypothetical protein
MPADALSVAGAVVSILQCAIGDTVSVETFGSRIALRIVATRPRALGFHLAFLARTVRGGKQPAFVRDHVIAADRIVIDHHAHRHALKLDARELRTSPLTPRRIAQRAPRAITVIGGLARLRFTGRGVNRGAVDKCGHIAAHAAGGGEHCQPQSKERRFQCKIHDDIPYTS